MAKSDNLRKAKAAKNDNFFTQIEDIIAEIAQHKDYVRQFEGKIVLCNCDDPEWSAFVEFFRKFFHKLKLKKMIATHYNADGSPSYKLEWSGEKINGDTVNMIKTDLKGDGDFASEECIELLKEADIVASNPPFSLWRQYVQLLEKYNKKYIIIGNKNAIAYKEIFPLLRDGKMFIGYNAGHGTMRFSTEPGGPADRSVPSYWYTNLDLDKSHEPLILTKNYKGNEEKYPKYDNYDAIECNKVANIPKDYFPCWYECPHAKDCPYAKTEGRGEALCEVKNNGKISDLGLTDNLQIGDAEKQASKQASNRTTALLESRSRTCQDTVQNSSRLSEQTSALLDQSSCQMERRERDDSTLRADDSTHALSFAGRKNRGYIGVPVTYMSGHCTEQFRIIGLDRYTEDNPDYGHRFRINGKEKYDRIIIQRKKEM